MKFSERLMACLMLGIFIAVFFGFVNGDRRTQGSAVVVAPVLATTVDLPPAPTLAELEVASRQALERSDKVSTEEKLELIEKVIDGAEREFADGSARKSALTEFDAWLEDLKAGRIVLNARDFDADLKDLSDYARNVGVPESEIKKREERAEMLRSRSKA